jgi:hypothetical protein
MNPITLDWAVAISIAAAFIVLGRTWGQVVAAHKRIDKLEKDLAQQFENFGNRLENAIRDAWRNCPLAIERHHKEE